jgi:hypothetical protein
MRRWQKVKLGKKADIVLPLLQALYDIKPVNRRSILLNHLDDEACEMIYETIRNVVFNEDLPKNARTRLKKNLAPLKKDVLTLARGKGSSTLKKKKLVQMGGFPLGTILSIAVPFLVEFVANKLRKK